RIQPATVVLRVGDGLLRVVADALLDERDLVRGQEAGEEVLRRDELALAEARERCAVCRAGRGFSGEGGAGGGGQEEGEGEGSEAQIVFHARNLAILASD